MARQSIPTHVVAVMGLVLKENRILLLKRNAKPMIWAPPGGRLLAKENPISGLQREINEECSMNVDVIMPVDTWFGCHDNATTICVLYLCRYVDGTLTLSLEHSKACWFTEESLREAIQASPDKFFGKANIYWLAFSLNSFLEHRRRI